MLAGNDKHDMEGNPLRARPLMIWGGPRKYRTQFFFPCGSLFFLEKGLRIFFSRFSPLLQIINGRALIQCRMSTWWTTILRSWMTLKILCLLCMCERMCQFIMAKGILGKRSVHRGNAGGMWMLRHFHLFYDWYQAHRGKCTIGLYEVCAEKMCLLKYLALSSWSYEVCNFWTSWPVY